MSSAVSFDVQMNGYLESATPNPRQIAPIDAVEIPVLIVGGGPSGLLQAYLLSRLGIQTLIVERYPERLGAPKAHALSPRSLEICRQFGLDIRKIRNLGTKRKDAFWVNFLTTLSGDVVGVLPYERMDEDVLDVTPEMIHNIPQPVFEQLVSQELLDAPNVDIRKGVSFLALEQNSSQVVTTVEERATGHMYTIRSRFVIACDGARSKVREYLAIDSEGETSYETMMTIHFNADLRPIVGDRVGMLHWIFDPVAAGFIIAYDLSNNAVLISSFDPQKHPVDSWSEDLCKQVLKGAIGKDIRPRILSYRPWLLSRKVAQSYRQGNVFLAGDAAHSFPPTGGLGLNSGLADVHNLAFKIAAVLQQQASPDFLDSYQLERRHVAEINSRQSVKNGKKIFTLLKALGTAEQSDLNAARAKLFDAIHDPGRQQEIADAIEQQREHFDNLNLHIGYVYGDTSIPANASQYLPKFVPGARLPHAWIQTAHEATMRHLPKIDLTYVDELSERNAAMWQYSTLDLCAPDAFTIILPNAAGPLHDQVALFNKRCEAKALKINVWCFAKDFDFQPTPSARSWIQGSGLKEGKALLVRPDQHILLNLTMKTTARDLLQSIGAYLGMEY